MIFLHITSQHRIKGITRNYSNEVPDTSALENKEQEIDDAFCLTLQDFVGITRALKNKYSELETVKKKNALELFFEAIYVSDGVVKMELRKEIRSFLKLNKFCVLELHKPASLSDKSSNERQEVDYGRGCEPQSELLTTRCEPFIEEALYELKTYFGQSNSVGFEQFYKMIVSQSNFNEVRN